jgi:hypothetical protein
VAGVNGGGIKAPSKPFSKLLQNSRVLLQAFPNKALTIITLTKVELEVEWRSLGAKPHDRRTSRPALHR